MTITRQGFSQVLGFAFSGMRFPAQAPHVVYPLGMFIPGSDLAPLKEMLDELVSGLTAWKPKKQAERVSLPTSIMVQGSDYEDALAKTNVYFLKRLWSDGLPIVPPTRSRVAALMRGTDLPADKVMARIMPRGGSVTVETLAANLAMAGGRPEYMPVLIAAVEAITAPAFHHELMNPTTCSNYPVVIVNGPVARQIRLASGYGCLGPDPVHPAGASIGRAIRFLLQGAGGAVPGKGTMSIFGGPARYTNIVFAEDEDGIPPDWQPLSVEQGFPCGANAATAYTVASTTNIVGGDAGIAQSALETLGRAAAFMAVPSRNYFGNPHNPEGAAGILIIARATAQGLSQLGWSKDKVKAYLWERAKITPSLIYSSRHSGARNPGEGPLPVSLSPKGIKIVVAGGAQSGHMMWMQVGVGSEKLTSAEIKLPRAWDTLLAKAEEDLGPLPEP
ncbi:MAG: hypothetical protein HYY32_06485 [Chloroflexi bacterium]|nr:hypothetical protein [Chloroflexota bacterium]